MGIEKERLHLTVSLDLSRFVLKDQRVRYRCDTKVVLDVRPETLQRNIRARHVMSYD